MKVMTIGEFKRRFSEALEAVREGETIVVSYGRNNHRKVAAMAPYSDLEPARRRKLGPLKAKARVKWGSESALSDEQLLKW